MGIEIAQSTQIAAPPENVWPLLVDASTWTTWWPDCIAAQAADFRPLREGSRLEVVLQPRHGKITLHPVVDLLTEHKTLSLTARSALLQTTVAWYLQTSDHGTRVEVRGAFAGLATAAMRLLRRDDTLRFSLNGNLRGLKRTAERLV